MKYKVTHSFLNYTVPNEDPNKVVTGSFKRDDYVTDADLKEAGFDPKFLIDNGGIEKLEGQDDEKHAPSPKPARR